MTSEDNALIECLVFVKYSLVQFTMDQCLNSKAKT